MRTEIYRVRFFSDEEEISLWAEKAVLWAERSGIITGDDAGYFHPGKKYKEIGSGGDGLPVCPICAEFSE